jgi:type VI secretion system protein ImpG
MDRISNSRRRLDYYNEELQYLREMGEVFARENPKVAGRLGLDSFECADPYVERLLEGVAFLTARVRMKLDDEFPSFTQSLVETVYPHYLCPTPSMTVVQFQPDYAEPSLAEGVTIPRDSVLRSGGGIGDDYSCQYRTGHDVTLWPIVLTEAEYYTREISSLGLPDRRDVSAGIRLRLKTMGGLLFSDIDLNKLTLFIRGGGDVGARLYEAIFSHGVGVVMRPTGTAPAWQRTLSAERIRQVGFGDDEHLLPYGSRSFQGYRLLHEFFAFPQRYMFFEIGGLNKYIGSAVTTELDIFILLKQGDPRLENEVAANNFVLNCAPAINLFPLEPDRVDVSDTVSRFHIVGDRTRPLDFEIYQVNRITGHGTHMGDRQVFEPFYSAKGYDSESRAYFSTHRMPRRLSERELNHGTRSGYSGSEVYVSLVDANAAPYSPDIRQLALETLCTNRDLPLLMQTGVLNSDFTLDAHAPVEGIRVVAGPTSPRASLAEGAFTWRIINHLSLNYLSLMDTEEGDAASALRELLGLYGSVADPGIRKQINSLRQVRSAPITRRVEGPGQIAFARGLEIQVTMEEESVEGAGTFLLGAVLERFFAKHVSLNSFTETVIQTSEQGELKRWKARMGQRKLV